MVLINPFNSKIKHMKSIRDLFHGKRSAFLLKLVYIKDLSAVAVKKVYIARRQLL